MQNCFKCNAQLNNIIYTYDSEGHEHPYKICSKCDYRMRLQRSTCDKCGSGIFTLTKIEE